MSVTNQYSAEAHGDRVRAALERFCDATACIPMPGERVTTTMVQTIGMALSEARAALEFKAQPKGTRCESCDYTEGWEEGFKAAKAQAPAPAPDVPEGYALVKVRDAAHPPVQNKE